MTDAQTTDAIISAIGRIKPVGKLPDSIMLWAKVGKKGKPAWYVVSPRGYYRAFPK